MPPRWLARLLFALRHGLRALGDRLVPAPVVLLDHVSGVAATQLLASVARLRITERLSEGPRTAAELAAATGTHPQALHRVLRALAAAGFLRLDARTGAFSNNRVSRSLAADTFGGLSPFARYFASPANVSCWEGLDTALHTGQSAFEARHGMTPWTYLAQHPEEESLFAEAMTSLTEVDALALGALGVFQGARSICDVGGGRGTLLAALLAAHPEMTGAVFDAPGVISLAEAFLKARGLEGRAKAVAGDLFGDVPPGFDAYVLKDVLHDWDDDRSLAILKNVRRAAVPGARLWICEVLVEPFVAAAPGAFIDVQMLVATSEGRQRSAGELAELLTKAGFEFRRVWRTAFPISLVEGVAG